MADYIFTVSYSCAPERVGELTAQVKSVVDQWRKTPPDPRFALDVASSQRKSFATRLEENRTWVYQIVFSVLTGTDIQKLIDREPYFSRISSGSLTESAQQFLDDSRYVEAVLFPEKK